MLETVGQESSSPKRGADGQKSIEGELIDVNEVAEETARY